MKHIIFHLREGTLEPLWKTICGAEPTVYDRQVSIELEKSWINSSSTTHYSLCRDCALSVSYMEPQQ